MYHVYLVPWPPSMPMGMHMTNKDGEYIVKALPLGFFAPLILLQCSFASFFPPFSLLPLLVLHALLS